MLVLGVCFILYYFSYVIGLQLSKCCNVCSFRGYKLVMSTEPALQITGKNSIGSFVDRLTRYESFVSIIEISLLFYFYQKLDCKKLLHLLCSVIRFTRMIIYFIIDLLDFFWLTFVDQMKYTPIRVYHYGFKFLNLSWKFMFLGCR